MTKEKYIDKYDQVWYRQPGSYYVFNNKCGYGGYFAGNGLKRIS